MIRFLIFFCFSIGLVSCNSLNKSYYRSNSTNKITFSIDTLFQDNISIRALTLDKNKVWYAADKSRYGFVDWNTNERKQFRIDAHKKDLEFRSIAQNENDIFILCVGNPALLYQISKKDGKAKLVYREEHENVFYDSLQFWNSKEGIAIGDPIDGFFSVITTVDGGQTWQKSPPNPVLKLVEGEAAFAASNTNIVLKKNHTWLVSGGKKSRVFHSGDKGKNWTVFETPIVQGKSMTGIFTADFYDDKKGFISGGNYEIPNQNFDNKAQTKDGGKTWKLVAQNQGFGYASCVQYVPKSNGKELISVGKTRLYYSVNEGETWQQFHLDENLFTIRFLDETTAYAAGKNKLIRIKIKK